MSVLEASSTRILAEVNGRGVTWRGLKKRIRLTREFVGSQSDDALRRVLIYVPSRIVPDWDATDPMRQAYADLYVLFGAERASRMVYRMVLREWDTRHPLRGQGVRA